MLEKLLSRTVIKDAATRIIDEPSETVRQLVERLTQEFKDRLHAAAETVEQYRYGVDKRRLTAELQRMVNTDETSRRATMRTIFTEALNQHPATFYHLVKTLGEIDFFDLVIKAKAPYGQIDDAKLTANDLLLPLQLDYELYIELIQTAQRSPHFKEWTDYLSGKVKEEEAQNGNAQEELKLNGAALPEIFPKINQYVTSAMRYAGGSSCQRGEKFEVIVEAFKKVAKELFGEEMDAFFGVATTKNLAVLISRFWSFYPDAEMVAGAYEYLPMWYAVSDPNKRHLVDVDNIDFTEEDLAESLLKKGEQIRKRRNIRGVSEKEPIVLLVSTQMRIGAKLMDTKKILAIVEAENERIGHKQYHVWFDASQDSRVVADGDMVFYSKRFAGSGGGMVLANNKTYPEDDGKDIKEALRLRSSYDASIIPRLIASLHLTSKKIGHGVAALIHTPGLWHYQGKGTFVAGEVEKASRFMWNSSTLRELFSIECKMPSDPAQWKVDAVLRVVPSEKALATLDIAQLGRDLKINFNVDCSSFSLDNLDGDFEKLNRALNAVPFNLNEFIRMVEEFQLFYQSWIVKALLPAEHRDDPEHVKAYFKQSVKEHNYFRLFVTALDRPNYLLDFAKRLEAAVRAQLDAPRSPLEPEPLTAA